MRRLVHLIALASLCFGVAVEAKQCAAPGLAGSPAGVTGIVNTYFPGTASAAVGSTSVTIGASTGAVAPIAAGDLLLIVQIQNATINADNTSGYGNGSTADTYGNGFTAIGGSGRYEYVRATNAIGTGGGTLSLIGANGAGLVNAYVNAAATGTTGQSRFQVVRVPQYATLSLTGALTATPWNGTSGGIVAIDVADRLTFSGGTINVTGLGFRGGGGRTLSGDKGANTDYRTLATVNTNAAKGEGIAGTPRYLNNGGTLLDTGVEGYPNGSQGRGAPGNAGGGGTDGNPAANDQNTGGGGGANGGLGGIGGNGWCGTGPNGCPATGGHPGAVAPNAVDRMMMGGGGGAGTTNNGTGTPGAGFASSGAAGGGLVFVRAGEIAGVGTISANGASANSTVTNDANGGGGAGGAIMISTLNAIAGASINASANGGNGGSNDGGGSAHGPGGGGGAGFVAATPAISVFANLLGGSAGTTVNGGTLGATYGAAPGLSASPISVSSTAIVGNSSGGECTPLVTKAFSVSPITPGAPSRMTVAVTNRNPDLALTGLAFLDSYPAALINITPPNAANSCVTPATLAATGGGSSFGVSAATINAASSCSYSVDTTATSLGDKVNTIASGGVTGSFGAVAVASQRPATATVQVSAPLTVTKTSVVYSDPVNNLVNPKLIPGGFVDYTITVTNPASYTVTTDSMIVIDATPANLTLFVNDIGGAGTGPVRFTDGIPNSALTYAFVSLGSTTDDIDFSNNGGTSWVYVPVPNGFGIDAAITHIRIRPKGAMAANSSFAVTFRYMIG